LPTDDRRRISARRRRTAVAALAVLLACACAGAGWPQARDRAAQPNIDGIVWQPDNATLDPRGNWGKLGVRQLLVQWTMVDGRAFVRTGQTPAPAPEIPDWTRISREPWAQEVILGLATRYDERGARKEIAELAEISKWLAALPTPLNVTGWYFPVEVDPTWTDAHRLGDVLKGLPRPLWISVYDNTNVGAETLADWLVRWLPDDVNVLFQDGVGIHTREASVARRYADVLADRLGKNRLRIIAEAFRPRIGGGFRPATLEELRPQLAAYGDHRLFLFDGPHYISEAMVCGLVNPRAKRC
jgi:hypothetical protein